VELRLPKKPPPSEVANLADSLEIVIQAQYGQVIGDLETAWQSSYESGSNVGNWICDRLRERYKTDVALVNAGGIRGGVDPGPVTKLDVLQLLPFSNSVVLFDATGGELRKVAEEQARAQGLRIHGVLEMSGLNVEFSVRDGRVLVTSVKARGEPLNDARIYRVASIDYVAVSQWDRYLGFEPRAVSATGELLSEVVMEEIAHARSAIHADATPRLVEVP
jgi:2',3'-cyclic-nucleotide 2'-phosphodiesterase (5'-nucleotidase family)